MGKRIWIVNYYTGTPADASNPRYVQFSYYFRQAGYEVVTFNADHAARPATPLFNRQCYGEDQFVHVRAPHYEGNGLKRMFSIWMFAWRIFCHCKAFERPDIILHNVHAPFDFPIVLTARRLHAKYISEVWDLWPDNFVNFGLVSAQNPIMKVFYRVERWIYEHADQLVFTLAGAPQYLKDKGWTTDTGGNIALSHVHYINNGVDLRQFDADRDAYPRSDEDFNRPDVYKIVYMGTISFANHVETLVDAAALLDSDQKYVFLIYGDGSDRERLEQYTRQHHIRNVHFKEKHIPLCEVAWVVSQATVNIMTYERGFGYMGVSSGKLFQYLAAGKPIVCNINIAYDDIITDHQLGVARDMDTPAEMAQEIRRLAEQPVDDYQAMCQRVRATAERFDYQRLAAMELEVISALGETEEK